MREIERCRDARKICCKPLKRPKTELEAPPLSAPSDARLGAPG